MSEYFFRLGMTEDMRRAVEDWRVENRDQETGRIPSFAEALRVLVQKGLEADG